MLVVDSSFGRSSLVRKIPGQCPALRTLITKKEGGEREKVQHKCEETIAPTQSQIAALLVHPESRNSPSIPSQDIPGRLLSLHLPRIPYHSTCQPHDAPPNPLTASQSTNPIVSSNSSTVAPSYSTNAKRKEKKKPPRVRRAAYACPNQTSHVSALPYAEPLLRMCSAMVY
jgi:hypothetical protein